jgi:hypothetical protein
VNSSDTYEYATTLHLSRCLFRQTQKTTKLHPLVMVLSQDETTQSDYSFIQSSYATLQPYSIAEPGPAISKPAPYLVHTITWTHTQDKPTVTRRHRYRKSTYWMCLPTGHQSAALLWTDIAQQTPACYYHLYSSSYILHPGALDRFESLFPPTILLISSHFHLTFRPCLSLHRYDQSYVVLISTCTTVVLYIRTMVRRS